jgi:hypothetical protein
LMETPEDNTVTRSGTGMREGGVKSRLQIEEIKRAKIGRAGGGASRSEDSSHARINCGRSRSKGGGTEDNVLQLDGREEWKTIRGIIRKGTKTG